MQPLFEIFHGPLDDVGCPTFSKVVSLGEWDIENFPHGFKLCEFVPEKKEDAMVEIERKFLIDGLRFLDKHKPHELFSIDISQGYLNLDPERTVRIRLTGLRGYMTVKGKSSENGLSRFEWEKEISQYDAQQMLKLCVGVINKTRYHVHHEGKLWEIDAFHDDNEGLLVAEVELTSETESIKIPSWVTEEVTGDPKFYNSNLIKHPFKDW